MVMITSIGKDTEKIMSGAEACYNLKRDVTSAVEELGFASDITISGRYKGCAINIGGIRLSQTYVDQYGHNISGFTGRRGRSLSWNQWIDLNNALNNLLDSKNLSANIKSLGGKFVIRDKETGRKKERDWDHLKRENVGSIMSPLRREDVWVPEK